MMDESFHKDLVWAVELAITWSREAPQTARLAGILEKLEAVVPGPEPQRKRPASGMAEEIYGAYPRKVGKLAALKSIRRAFAHMEPEDILAKVQAYAASVAGEDKQYVPHPSTWFNQGRYLDEIEEATEQVRRPQL